ncbi:MAG: O-antigen ligase family protein [bacterium]
MGLVSLIIFTPLAFGTVQVWSITVVHLITLAMLAAWLIKMTTLGKFKLIKTPLDLPILLFLGIAAVTTLTSIYPYASKIELYKIINYVLLYYLVVNNIKDKRQIKRIATLVVIVGTSLALYGLYNYFSGIEKIYTLDKKYYLGMLTSTYVNHNHIGGYFELAIPLGIGLVLANQYLPGRTKRSKIPPPAFVSVLLVAAIFIMITALVFTYSRGAWIGFLGSMIALGMIISFRLKTFRDWSRLKKWGTLVVVVLIIISAPLLMPDKVKQRAATLFEFEGANFKDMSLQGRLIVNRNTLKMIKDHPILGTGPGTFTIFYPQYRDSRIRIFMNATHNDYLQYGEEMGLFGLGSFVVLLVLFFKKNLSLLKSLSDKYLQSLTIGFLVSITAIAIHGLGDFNLQIPANALLFWIILALSSSLSIMVRPERMA